MEHVVIVEVGPRDGLQSEPVVLPTEAKVELIGRLVDAGARRVEVGSFAHPGRPIAPGARCRAVPSRPPSCRMAASAPDRVGCASSIQERWASKRRGLAAS